jgi:phage shock protein A
MRGLPILVPGALLFSIAPAHADDADLRELQQEVEILRREVKVLHARIDTLEGKRESVTARASTSEPAVARTSAPPPTGKHGQQASRFYRRIEAALEQSGARHDRA